MQKRWAWLLAVVVLVTPGVVDGQTEWVEDPANPVIAPADPGAWDGGERYPLAVIKVDGIYHLYFNGQEAGSPFLGSYDIGHATSTDGVSWEMDPANPVLIRGAEGEWDDLSLWGSAVIHDESGFRMWYSGSNVDSFRPGYATSVDGSVWTKYAGNPIMDVGPPGSFDDQGVMPNTVILQNGTYQMWYTSSKEVGTGPNDYDWRVGYAESADGLSWTKNPEPVFEADEGWDGWVAFGASVLYDGSIYHMWYEGGVPGIPAVGYAVSPDGIEWTRFWGNPVLANSSQEPEFPSVLVNEDTGVHEMWFGNFRDSGIGRATSSCCSTIFPSFIPAAAYAAGAEGSFYETDVDISNAGAGEAEYYFAWLPRGESNGDPMRSELFTLGAGQSVRYANVLAEVFDLEPDSFGALIIDASSQDVLVMARIANILDEGEGTFGQGMPAVSIDDFSGLRERRRLVFGTENADMRFNVGCQNASDTAARVNFELFSSDGTLVGSESMILMPWSNDQLNRVFDEYQPITGCIDFWSDTAPGQIFCYGSVLDNVTSDPTTIPPM